MKSISIMVVYNYVYINYIDCVYLNFKVHHLKDVYMSLFMLIPHGLLGYDVNISLANH